MISNLDTPVLVLPKNFVKKKKAIMAWFRTIDQKLVEHVTTGNLRIAMAQTYYKLKIEGNPDLTKEDKQRLATESKIWKMPS